MTVYENRLIYIIMASLSRHQERFEFTEIPVSELKKLLGADNKSIYKLAQETIDALESRGARIGSEKEGWTHVPWFSAVSYVPASKHPERISTVKLQFHKELEPYLLQQKLQQGQQKHNTVSLSELLRIPTYTSARLFELIYYDSMGGRLRELKYEIPDLKKRLGLEYKYERFADFRYVLDRAQQDLARYTSLSFDYAAVREGLAYAFITFNVGHSFTEALGQDGPSPASYAWLDHPIFNATTQELRSTMARLGYEREGDEALEKYGTDRIRRSIAFAEDKILAALQSARPIQNSGALLTYIIENDIAQAHLPQRPGAAQALSPQEIRDLSVRVETNYSADLRETCKVLLHTMAEADVDMLHSIMRAQLDPLTLGQLEKHAWQGAIYEDAVSTTIYRYQRGRLPTHYQDLRQWVKKENLLHAYSSKDQDLIVSAALARQLL